MKAPESRSGILRQYTRYIPILATLVILTAAEVAVSFIAGGLRNPILIGMSLIKALLVIFYYMHLRYDSRWYILIFFIPFILIILLFAVINQ
jgi:cytochrome c oxidase subunit 4